MSKIATVTGVANAQNLRVQYDVGALDLNLQIDKPANFADAKAFLARLATLEIEVNKQTQNRDGKRAEPWKSSAPCRNGASESR